MGDAAAQTIRGWKDTDGRPLLDINRALADMSEPATLLGWPVYLDPHANPLATGNRVVMFADPTKYVIREGPPFLRIGRSDQFKFDEDKESWRILAASGLGLVDTTAAVALELA